MVSPPKVGTSIPHPIPRGCSRENSLADWWAEEMGWLLSQHESVAKGNESFIGVACESAFSGGAVNQYEDHQMNRVFPLVGPKTCDCTSVASLLTDAYEYEVPDNIAADNISFSEAYRNCSCLGRCCIEKPIRGSHYMVKFPGKRSWPLDKNVDPLPERFLKELVPITGYSLPTIKYILKTGEKPKKRLKLEC